VKLLANDISLIQIEKIISLLQEKNKEKLTANVIIEAFKQKKDANIQIALLKALPNATEVTTQQFLMSVCVGIYEENIKNQSLDILLANTQDFVQPLLEHLKAEKKCQYHYFLA
jgi:hypothetical protein